MWFRIKAWWDVERYLKKWLDMTKINLDRDQIDYIAVWESFER